MIAPRWDSPVLSGFTGQRGFWLDFFYFSHMDWPKGRVFVVGDIPPADASIFCAGCELSQLVRAAHVAGAA